MVLLCHPFHKANGSANALAKEGRGQEEQAKEYLHCPMFVRQAFGNDLRRIDTTH